MTRRITRRRPVAKSVRRVRFSSKDPSHPRVGLHTSQTRRTCAADVVLLRPDAAQSSNLWNTLTDGGKATIRGREYVCLGWVPLPSKAGVTVAIRLWGECATCGAGFETTNSQKNLNSGYVAKGCPQHRRKASA